MNKCQSFFALCKLYCAINVLLVPKAFANGGYLASPIIVLISCSFQSACAIRLTHVGNYTGKINYPDIVNVVFGKCGKRFIEVSLAMVHFQFTIAQLSFCIQGLKHLAE